MILTTEGAGLAVACPITGTYSFSYSRGQGLCSYPLSSLHQCSGLTSQSRWKSQLFSHIIPPALELGSSLFPRNHVFIWCLPFHMKCDSFLTCFLRQPVLTFDEADWDQDISCRHITTFVSSHLHDTPTLDLSNLSKHYIKLDRTIFSFLFLLSV